VLTADGVLEAQCMHSCEYLPKRSSLRRIAHPERERTRR
jgi:hypothetical protein